MSLTKKYSQHTRKWESKKESVDLSPEKLQAEIDRLEEALTRTIAFCE